MTSQEYWPPGQNVPSLTPPAHFDADADAAILRKAMKGIGTDEKAIIEVLAKRGIVQRQAIIKAFEKLCGKDLISDLKSELGGKLKDVIIALMTPLPKFYAKELHHAISGAGTDEEAIIEILCSHSLSNFGIKAVKEVYPLLYKKSLEDDLKGDSSGQFKHLLVSLCKANREETQEVDQAAARADATAMIEAKDLKRWDKDESTIHTFLVTRSVKHLQQVFVEYKQLCGRDIEVDIKTEFSGSIERALLTLVKSAKNKVGYFAERLHSSMAGLGTKDRTLIRIIVSRCEIDLGNISVLFHQKYGKTLASFISGDTSGDYKKVLLTLAG